MRRELFILVPCLLIAVAAAPALAEEVIYFTNGTSMPIRSHDVRGEMIHVDLGSDAFMAFPLYMVEKIEEAGKEVVLTPSFSAGNKIMAGRTPTPEGSYPAKGSAPGRYSDAESSMPRLINRSEMVDEDGKMGVAVHRPLKYHRGENRRGLGTVGRTDLEAQSSGEEGDGYYGSTKKGTRNVIGGNNGRLGPGGKPKAASPVSLSRAAAGQK